MQIIQWQFTFAFARTARVTLCVEILKVFKRHFASFTWQKLSVIVELEKQSMTFSVKKKTQKHKKQIEIHQSQITKPYRLNPLK